MKTLFNIPTQLALLLSIMGCSNCPNVPLGTDLLKVVNVCKEESSSKTEVVPIDPLLAESWHLKNTGQKTFANRSGIIGFDLNVTPVWSDNLTGNGVRIAVSDDGIEGNHEDLRVNILSGESRNYDLASRNSKDPTPTLHTDNHGTAVAGIISAMAKNGLGSSGVAPNSKIASFNFMSDGVNQTESLLLDQANGNFDIFNQSWGRGQSNYSPISEAYRQQLAYGVTVLRGGKGVLYVKSAGNSFTVNNADGSLRGFGNSNIDALNTTPYTIITAAVNARGEASSYSSPGANVWISAPGGEFGTDDPAILSTDRTGCTKGIATSSSLVNTFDAGQNGNSNCNYTSAMNGTSSAAPNLSGVIALMLEAKPSLTWRDVKYILASTARVIESDIPIMEGDGLLRGPLGHVFEAPWQTNAAGFKFHNWFGFGLVDAKAAIDFAKNYTTPLPPYGETKDAEGNWYHSSGPLNLTIPDNSASGVTSTIEVVNDLVIEAVQIELNVTHPQVGDLGIELTSPNGTKSILLNVNNGMGGQDNFEKTVFLSNAFYGESSIGTWTIKIVDGWFAGTGKLTNWKLNLVGGVKPLQPIPEPPSNLSHALYFNSLNSSPLISWSKSASPFVRHYEYSIGSQPGATDIRDWTAIGNQATLKLGDSLNLVNDQIAYLNLRSVTLGNSVSGIVSSPGWTVDILPPTAPTELTHDLAFNSTNSSPYLSWSQSEATDIDHYEYSIGTSPGVTDIRGWTNAGTNLGTQATGLNLTVGQTYFPSVRAVDRAGNASAVISSSGWLYSTSAPPSIQIGSPNPLKINSNGSAIFTVTYTGASNITLAATDVTLNQTNVVCQKAIDGSGLGTRNIVLLNCTGSGTVTVSILANTATNSVGIQAGAKGPSAALAVDNTPPTITGLSNDSNPTRSKTWNWSCNEAPCKYRFLVDTSPSSSPTGDFVNTTSTTQAINTGTYYLHIQAQDAVGNLSAVTHAAAILDNTAPSITGLANDTTWSTSKTWNWGCSELNCSYSFVIDSSSSTAPSNSFSTATTSSKTGVSGKVYLHIQAKDSAGNLSSVGHFSALIDSNAPTAPTSLSLARWNNSKSSTPSLSWVAANDSGSGLSHYQIAIGTTAGATNILNWKDIGNVTSIQLSGLTLNEGGTYYPSLRAKDILGNISNVTTGSNWRVDTVKPTVPSNFNDGTKLNEINRTPAFSWTAATDETSGVFNYQISLGSTVGGTDVLDWTSIGNVLSHTATSLTLTAGQTYYASIRAIDTAGLISDPVNGDGWLVPPCSPSGLREFLANNGMAADFVVPSGCTTLLVKAWGAGGGNGGRGENSPYPGGLGASGAFARGLLPVTPLESLLIVVGEKGWDGASANSSDRYATHGAGGGGGGFSAIHRNQELLILAGGGGGGGGGKKTYGESAPGKPGRTSVISCDTLTSLCSAKSGGDGDSYSVFDLISGGIGGFSGQFLRGGNGGYGTEYGGGGGGGGAGFFGGKGAGHGVGNGGGGGYGGTSFLHPTTTETLTEEGTTNGPGGASDTNYIAPYGQARNDGRVIIIWGY